MKLKIICRMIQWANSAELNTITRQILRRYAELFEDEEVVFLSLPKYDCSERRRILEAVIDLEQKNSEHIKNPG